MLGPRFKGGKKKQKKKTKTKTKLLLLSLLHIHFFCLVTLRAERAWAGDSAVLTCTAHSVPSPHFNCFILSYSWIISCSIVVVFLVLVCFFGGLFVCQMGNWNCDVKQKLISCPLACWPRRLLSLYELTWELGSRKALQTLLKNALFTPNKKTRSLTMALNYCM